MTNKNSVLDSAFRIGTAFVSFSLLAAGGWLALGDKTASASACLGFGFLILVITHISKFRKFKGFGFEAEMWEDKQKEAETLIDTLRETSVALAKQMVFVADHIGKWDGPSGDEMLLLMGDLEKILGRMNVPHQEIQRTLSPLVKDAAILKAYDALNAIKAIIGSADSDIARDFMQRINTLSLVDATSFMNAELNISDAERRIVNDHISKYKDLIARDSHVVADIPAALLLTQPVP